MRGEGGERNNNNSETKKKGKRSGAKKKTNRIKVAQLCRSYGTVRKILNRSNAQRGGEGKMARHKVLTRLAPTSGLSESAFIHHCHYLIPQTSSYDGLDDEEYQVRNETREIGTDGADL